MGISATQAEGKLVVGVSRTIVANVLMPHFGELRSRHPDLRLDLRTINYAHEPAAALCDVLLVIGWQEDSDWVAQLLARGRHSVLASPAFWAEHGKPMEPGDLLRLPCLAHRVPRGVVLDRWKFRRGEDTRSVPLEPIAVFDDRDALAEAAARGHGVMFGNDVTLLRWLQSGALEVGLKEWVGLEAPPVHLMHRRGARGSARVRAFADFITGVFAQTMREREAYGPADTTAMPEWFHTRYTGRLAGRFA
jgi:DNA-binding transcriptional LysR family regulator